MADSHTRYVKSGGCASQYWYKNRVLWCNGARNHDGRHWSVARPATKKVPKPEIRYWSAGALTPIKKAASFSGMMINMGKSVENVNKAIINYKIAYSGPVVPYGIIAEDITVSPDFYDEIQAKLAKQFDNYMFGAMFGPTKTTGHEFVTLTVDKAAIVAYPLNPKEIYEEMRQQLGVKAIDNGAGSIDWKNLFVETAENLDYNTVTIIMMVPVIYGPPPEKKHDVFVYSTQLPMFTDLWTPFDVVGLLRDEVAKLLKEKYKDGLAIHWSEATLAKSPGIIGVTNLVKHTMTVPFEYY